jgi:hypothetical protein
MFCKAGGHGLQRLEEAAEEREEGQDGSHELHDVFGRHEIAGEQAERGDDEGAAVSPDRRTTQVPRGARNRGRENAIWSLLAGWSQVKVAERDARELLGPPFENDEFSPPRERLEGAAVEGWLPGCDGRKVIAG